MNAVIINTGHGSRPLRRSVCPIQAASERKLRALVTQYRELVLRSLRRMGISGGDVDDVTQRVFLVVARKLDLIEAGRERAYVLGIATRIASEVRRVEARRQRREVSLGFEFDAESEQRTDDLLDQKRTRQLLNEVLSAMPHELTTVFVLAEGEGLTAPEISQRLGIPVGTVASRLRRAREYCQRHTSKLRDLRPLCSARRSDPLRRGALRPAGHLDAASAAN